MAKKNKELGVTAQLRDFIKRNPFVPFDIKTSDGDTFHVFHPDFAMISPRGDTAIIYEKDSHHRVLNLRIVVSLEPSRSKGAFRGPGKK